MSASKPRTAPEVVDDVNVASQGQSSRRAQVSGLLPGRLGVDWFDQEDLAASDLSLESTQA